VNGQVVGLWSRTEKKSSVVIDLQLFKACKPAEKAGIAQAAERFGKFLGKAFVMG